MSSFPLINRGLTLSAMVTLVLMAVLAALLVGASAVSAQGSAPDAPDRPVGTAVFIGGVDLEWNEVPGADSYDVQMYRNGQWTDLPGDGIEIAFYGAGAIISELEPEGSSYWFRVRARSVHGFSEWSDFNFMASTNESRLGRRARPDNVPASGAPVISGTAQVGESLTADATGIEDGNGLDRVQLRFQWVSHDGSADTDIANATGSTYILVADDAGKTIKARVAFTDRGGYSESLTGGETATVAARPNSPATGAPSVTGTTQVGETLTADTSGIADADGLTKVSYSYQWVANDGNVVTDITDATGSTYTLAAYDEGKIIKVKVSFSDDAGNGETLTSSATAAVEAAPNTPATGAPAISGTAQVGETLTADTSGISDADGLADATFAYQWLADGTGIAGATGDAYILTTSEMGKTIKVRVSFTDEAGNEETLTSTATGTVSPAVQPQTANSPATGAPIITGTAEVAEILTASTSGIADDDGLVNAIYSYQWIANDGGTDADISGETDATYTLVADDVGKIIKVRVSFTDDAGTDETLTSTETEAVSFAVQQQVANNPATGAPTFSGTTQEDRNLWADTSGIADADGLTKVSYSYQWIRNDGTSDTNITDATESWYFLVSDDVGQTIKVKVTFTDDAGNQESLTSEATGKVAPARPRGYMTVVVTGTNSTVTWNDSGDCSTDYNIYKRSSRDSGGEVPRTHLGFATSGSSEATVAISESSSGSYRTHSVTLELYCGTYDSDSSNNELVASTEVPIREGTYSWAPLTALTVSPGTLTPDFDRGGKKWARYTVEVPSDVEVITLYTTVLNGYQTDFIKDPGWGIVRVCNGDYDDCIYGYGGGYILSDADPDAEGFQINLDRGENRLGIGVNLGSLNVESLGRVYGLTVTVQSAPATGTPTINGTAQVEKTLTADTSGIADADGLTNISYSYQWIRNDGTSDTDIAGATDATYTLVAADVGKTIKVRVTFTDDASNDESLTSEATGAVATNGAPTGTVEVGETLTADTSGIEDEDGLDNVSFSYQWIRTDGTADLDIDGATSATYTITATDVGHAIKVRVSYTDDAGNVESLTSAATVTVPLEVTFAFNIEGTTVTCDYYNIHVANGPIEKCNDPISTVQGANGEIDVEIEIARSVSSQLYKFDFHIFQLEDSLGNYWHGGANDLCMGPGLADSALIEVTPDDGTGPYTYTNDGTIFGLCAAGTYELQVRWFRYNYTDQDYQRAGNFVRYFFITPNDDEEDTSIEKVKWITALYPDPPISHEDVQIEATKESEVLNRELATYSLSIGGLVPDSDPETTDYVVRLGLIGPDGRGVAACHVGDVGYSYLLKTVPEDGEWAMEAHLLGSCIAHWRPELLRVELFDGSDLTDYSEPIVFHGSHIISNTGELQYPEYGTYRFIAGKDIVFRPQPTIPETTIPETTIPETRGPTISGTAQVGETLTVDPSGMVGTDGEYNVSFSYQWIAIDGTAKTHIVGATDSTYTLVADDAGKTIIVRVNRLSFTDDGVYSVYTWISNSTATEVVTFAVQQQVANTPATGTPTISGTVEVGETLIVNTSGIADDDGLDNVSYSYQWVVNDGTTDTDISGETDDAYTLVADDVNKIISVKVTFTDDAGNEEALTSAAATAVAAKPNTPATDLPTIHGTARVGETLTADTSGIADADGLSGATFSYQWIRNDGTSDTDITGATDSSYTLLAAHEGKTIKVRVSFTDDADNGETMTSTATAEVAAGAPTDPPGAPRNLTGTANSDGTVTLSWDAPDDDSVTGYQILRRSPTQGERKLLVYVNDTGTTATEYTDNDVTPDELYAYRVKAINPVGISRRSEFVNATPTLTAEPAQNSPATGVPTITGTAQVGETLAADTAGIADADGLTNVTYSYQWIVNDGTADTDITGETDFTYILVAADEGKTIKVRVSFTDDAGNEETLTSAATVSVAARPNSPATGAPIIGGTVQVGETLTADTSGIADADGLSGATFSYQWVANDGTTDTNISGATDNTYTLVDDDEGMTIKVRVTIIDDAENETTLTSAATEAVGFAVQQQGASNTPATGQPTISGTAQVGEMLTADTTGIADEDGLEDVAFSYQWLSDDAEIGGATGSTYTPVADDEGKTITVQVSFTDDGGNDETLTSTATDVVAEAARPNSPATGAPAITGTAQVGETLTADTTGIADEDGLEDVAFSYQWLSDDAEIGGATGSTYTPVADDEGKTITVQVSFTDDGGNDETLTSTATDVVAEAARPNSPATGAPAITGTAQVGETLTADTTGIADEDGLEDVAFSYQWLSDDAEIGGATGSTYTPVADDEGKTITVQVSFTDDLGNATTLTSAATEAVAAAPQPDSPATGEPTITGTAQVGQTLSVDTSGITDADGLDSAVFAYQWLSDDAGIGGATGSTYTLVDDDEGRTIKVRVTVTDDLGNETTLTSAATEAVEAKRNTAATGRPTISGTVRVGETLTADTTGIADADGLTNVSYRYQWVVTDGSAYIDISGEKGATYTLVSADRGLRILVRVSFTDDAGKRERLTSAATDVVAAAA